MDVSVIIPARNERGFIGFMLLALEQQIYDGSWEAIVVDNASDDRTGDAVQTAFPWVRVIEEPVPGVQRARERGRVSAKGAILAFLDADTVPSVQWIENGLRYFRDPSIVAVTGSYDFYDSGPVLQLDARFVSACVYPVALWFTQDIRHSGIMIGGNCFIRACALEDIGGFNTAIDFWGDDTDTAIRLPPGGGGGYARGGFCGGAAKRYYRDGIIRTLWNYVYHAARISARSFREQKHVVKSKARL